MHMGMRIVLVSVSPGHCASAMSIRICGPKRRPRVETRLAVRACFAHVSRVETFKCIGVLRQYQICVGC